MTNTMSYKGYYGSVEFSDEDDVFFGKIIGINDRINFDGDNVRSLRSSFEEAVDGYLDVCAQIGKEPEKAYKGSFNVRIGAELHRKAATTAFTQGISLNTLVENAIKQSVG